MVTWAAVHIQVYVCPTRATVAVWAADVRSCWTHVRVQDVDIISYLIQTSLRFVCQLRVCSLTMPLYVCIVVQTWLCRHCFGLSDIVLNVCCHKMSFCHFQAVGSAWWLSATMYIITSLQISLASPLTHDCTDVQWIIPLSVCVHFLFVLLTAYTCMWVQAFLHCSIITKKGMLPFMKI